MIKGQLTILFLLAAATSQPTTASAQVWQSFSFPEADACGSWTVERQGGRRNQAMEGWVLGFVSGRNKYGGGDGRLGSDTNGYSLLAWIDRYCDNNPLDTVTKAALELVKELERRRAGFKK
ncbi:hypothetical protein [Sphingomonas sp.]|uniref:hypothetical protein n=1 Tax=Sphingomonas sp. TaxID=28214 RepID=UPI0028AD1B3F|nr:hypothetical protein [Sphingomonas sp.]